MPSVPLSQVAVRLRPQDNVAVAARHLTAGAELTIDGHHVALDRRVGMGHKIALAPISAGEPVLKYGQIIGFAAIDIAPGDHVHVHNVRAYAFERDYAFCSEVPLPAHAGVSPEPRSFMGYDRGPDRSEHLRYGTRNYLAIISTVNCSASTSKYSAERLRARGVLDGFPNVDGVLPIVHKQGCAMQYDGPDHHQLERTLAGFARHPNVAAYILIGLGCETGQAIHLVEGERLLQLNGLKRKFGSRSSGCRIFARAQ